MGDGADTAIGFVFFTVLPFFIYLGGGISLEWASFCSLGLFLVLGWAIITDHSENGSLNQNDQQRIRDIIDKTFEESNKSDAKELADEVQITQQLEMGGAQNQISKDALAQKQHELAIAQQEKEQLEVKLAEAEKNNQIIQNITYNITDSSISGDITNKINRND